MYIVTLRCICVNHHCSNKKQQVLIIMTVCLRSCLAIWHAYRIFSVPYYISICGMSGSAIFFHIISQIARLSENNLLNIKCTY